MKPAMFVHDKILWMQGNDWSRMDRLKSFIERNPADAFSRHALAMEYIKIGDDAAAIFFVIPPTAEQAGDRHAAGELRAALLNCED